MVDKPFLVSIDLGGVDHKSSFMTLDEAIEYVDRMPDPEGYSSHSATIYVWLHRKVDGQPYLKALQRYWFGWRVDKVLS